MYNQWDTNDKMTIRVRHQVSSIDTRKLEYHELATALVCETTISLRSLRLCKYMIQISCNISRTRTLTASNRLVTLDFQMSPVRCINSSIYKMNMKRKYTLLPSSVLFINVLWSRLYRAPSGFFFDGRFGGIGNVFPSRQRESLVRLHFLHCLYVNFKRVPKSVIVFDPSGDYPNTNSLRERGILTQFVYNVYPRIQIDYTDFYPSYKLKTRRVSIRL